MAGRSRSLLLVGAVLLATQARAGEAPVRLVRPPAIAEAPDGVRVDFEVSRLTDVAVRVLDANGRPVRHLVAGMLGKNPPAPLAADGVRQSLLWDRRDDAGRPVPAGEYRIEVGAGLGIRSVTFFGWNPRVLGTVHGLAVGPKAVLYVMSESGRDTREPKVVLMDAGGAYQRTIVPRPAGLPLDRVLPLNELVLNDGTRVPQELLPQHGARGFQQPAVTPEGDLIFVSTEMRTHNLGHRYHSVNEKTHVPRRLLRLAADGGAPAAGYLGPVLGDAFGNGMLFLALAADGTVYLSGARHAVFKVKWGEKETPAPVLGTPDREGGGETGLKDPAGIALDKAGNLYVADRGNHRVAAFSPEGQFLGQISIEWPRWVLVDPRSGALYVTAGFRQQTLFKFASLKDAKPAAQLDLRSNDSILCLDPSSARPFIYAANVGARAAEDKAGGPILVRLTDTGIAFEVMERSEPGAVFQPLLLGLDREREKVYGFTGAFAPYFRVDGHSLGEPEPVQNPLAAKANGIHELSAGADGTVIFHVKSEMGRLNHLLQPLPYAAVGSHIADLPDDDTPRSFYDRGSCVAPNGDIYWVHERGGYSKPMLVTALNADGSVKKDPLIVFESRSPAGIRVDRQGNVYVIDHLKPLGQLVPPAFAGKVPIERLNRFIYNYGSLVKFGPAGGAIRELSRGKAPATAPDDGRLHYTTAEGRGHFAGEGVLWSYFGASMIQPALDRDGCQCWSPRFDIDDFARVFVPDQLKCTVHVLDTNGNPILDVGRYGNVDDKGAGVALADPRTVMVSREALYIGDMQNNRVVRVAFSYQAKAAVTVKVGPPAVAKSLAEIEKAFADGAVSAADRPGLVAAAAALRAEALKAEVVALSPFLAKGVNWVEVTDALAAQAALPSAEDARTALCLAVRNVPDWPVAEARAFLGAYLKDGAERVRLAAVWALWNEAAGKETAALLREALKDQSALVRITAADTLLAHEDPAGLAEVFRAARSTDPVVFKLAETAILKKVTVYDADHPQARLVDPSQALVPKFPIGKTEVEALVPLLDTDNWYLRRAAIFLIALSGEPAAGLVFLDRLAKERNRNLNRTIGALGLLRYRPAVPDLVKFVERGRSRDWGTDDYDGDQAEVFAADALVRIGDPASVEPLIGLLTSERRTVPELVRRTLSRMFEPAIAADRVLLPKDGRLVQVRLDEVPDGATLKSAWEAFWKANAARYEANDKGPGLKTRSGG